MSEAKCPGNAIYLVTHESTYLVPNDVYTEVVADPTKVAELVKPLVGQAAILSKKPLHPKVWQAYQDNKVFQTAIKPEQGNTVSYYTLCGLLSEINGKRLYSLMSASADRFYDEKFNEIDPFPCHISCC